MRKKKRTWVRSVSALVIFILLAIPFVVAGAVPLTMMREFLDDRGVSSRVSVPLMTLASYALVIAFIYALGIGGWLRKKLKAGAGDEFPDGRRP